MGTGTSPNLSLDNQLDTKLAPSGDVGGAAANVEQFEGTQTYRAFEYRITDVEGVKWNRDFPGFIFEEQREVTIPNASPEQVVAVREVLVHARYCGWHPET